jgi:two-component system sporulation sensor kinase A
MLKMGQITLVMISVLFTAYQWNFNNEPFFTADFFIFTLIAWVVGWQYDRVRVLENKARTSEESYKALIESLPEPVIIHRDYEIVFVNKAAATMIGSKCKDELIG